MRNPDNTGRRFPHDNKVGYKIKDKSGVITEPSVQHRTQFVFNRLSECSDKMLRTVLDSSKNSSAPGRSPASMMYGVLSRAGWSARISVSTALRSISCQPYSTISSRDRSGRCSLRRSMRRPPAVYGLRTEGHVLCAV